MNSGVYLFSIPYLTRNLNKNSEGFVKVKPVDIELHVRRKEDLDQDIKLTVLATSAEIAFSNFVEDIFGNVRKCFFSKVFPRGIDEKNIRWVQINPEAWDCNEWMRVHLTWDEEKQFYSSLGTSWSNINSNDWFYQYYQEKIRYFSKLGLSQFEKHDLSEKHLEKGNFYEASNLKLKDSAPDWLARIIQRTKTEINNAHLYENAGIPTVINGLKYFAGDNTYFDYNREVNLLILDEINKLQTPNLNSHYV